MATKNGAANKSFDKKSILLTASSGNGFSQVVLKSPISGLLGPELLDQVIATDVPGQKPADFGLPSWEEIEAAEKERK